ncbi:MAG: hypothetical protein WC192_03395 [Candidatus Babeliales bacterium]|jgi:hypothetical protein
MKKLIKSIVFVISLLNCSSLFSMQQPEQRGVITRTIEGVTYTYETQANVFSCEIDGIRYVLRHPHMHDQEFYAANIVTGQRVAFPAGANPLELINLLMPRLAAIQRPQELPQVPQQSLTTVARNLFLHWGLPVRLDVNPLVALRDELRRATAAWNRPVLKTFFILLGELTVFHILLSTAISSGSYSSQINNRLIPSFNTLINPAGMFSRHTHNGATYFTPATRSDAMGNLMGVCMMPLVYSYIAYFGLHAAEDFFCLIGALICSNWQTIFVGRGGPQGNARQ